jgi:hypothetical protein
MSDTSNWIEKRAAVSILGVSEKTLERWAAAKKIRSKSLTAPGQSSRAIYHPRDIERLAAARRGGSSLPAPAVAPVELPPPPPGPSVSLIALTPEQFGELLDRAAVPQQKMIAAAQEGAAHREETLSLIDLRSKIYLTVAEARRLTGLPLARLREAVHAGAVTQMGRLYRRADLERL